MRLALKSELFVVRDFVVRAIERDLVAAEVPAHFNEGTDKEFAKLLASLAGVDDNVFN